MESHEPVVLPFGTPVPDGMADAGTAPSAERVRELVDTGRPVLVTLAADPGPGEGEGAEALRPSEGAGDPGPGEGAEPDPGLLAAASVYAWLGVRAFRAPESMVPALRQVLDMVASIQGTRPPALTRRGLA